jgi:hypothetical protein
MYKDKDSDDDRLTMGPIWDYNLAFGNADYYGGWDPTGWQMDIELGEDYFKIPFWWYRIWNDETFRIAFNQRWQDLRQSVFSEDYIMNMIDSATTLIDEAQVRNFQRWPVLDEYVWPNAYVGGSYENEIDYLKGWITDHLDWVDQQVLMAVASAQEPGPYKLDNAYPNPFNPATTIGFSIPRSDFVKVKIYDTAGREITTLVNGEMVPGQHRFKWDGENQASGIYFIQMVCSRFEQTKTVILLK